MRDVQVFVPGSRLQVDFSKNLSMLYTSNVVILWDYDVIDIRQVYT